METYFALFGNVLAVFAIRAVIALLIFLVFAWLARIARHGAQRSLARTTAHMNSTVFFGRVIQGVILIVGSILAIAAVGWDFSGMAALLGFIAVAATLAVQDITRNAIAGWYLLIEHPFQVGDLVEVEGAQGVIEDVGTRTTILRTAQGERVIVPNQVMFTSVVTQKRKEAS